MGGCFLVASSYASYYVHTYGYFLASVCRSLLRFYKRGMKKVLKFLETHAKKLSHRRPMYV